jgi:hypothetical protein
MAKVLKKIFIPTTDEIVQNFTIESWHVSQSVDAFTGTEAYDILLSGSLTVTGSVAINGLTNTSQNNVLTYNTSTGLVYYTASSAFAPTSASSGNPAPSDTYIQYNLGGVFGASQYFRYIYSVNSLQQGLATNSVGEYSHAEGAQTKAFGGASHAEGYFTVTNGTASHAEGFVTSASGDFSHAEGTNTIASGYGSHSEGSFTLSSGQGSHSEGAFTTASGAYSHAEGYLTKAEDNYTHAEGRETIASGEASHAEGRYTTASGDWSHAEGGLTLASNAYTHAEGYNTRAIVGWAHAEGESTLAEGLGSHTEGQYTTASGNASYAHAEGLGTVANGNYQHVMGSYNISSSNATAFIIGNGTTSSSRSNLVYASGSLVQITGSTSITSTLTTSGSRVRRYRTLTLEQSDYSLNPTPSIQSDDDILLIIDNTTGPTGGAGEGNLNITNFLNSPAGRCVEIIKIKDGTGSESGIKIVNVTMAGSVLYLNDSTQSNGIRTICSSVGNSITLMSLGTTPSGSAWGNGY